MGGVELAGVLQGQEPFVGRDRPHQGLGEGGLAGAGGARHQDVAAADDGRPEKAGPVAPAPEGGAATPPETTSPAVKPIRTAPAKSRKKQDKLAS